MKNENKCFFSISLENGIIITGNSPEKVNNYLYEIQDAYYIATRYYLEWHMENIAKEYKDNFYNIDKAIETIEANNKQKHEN